MYKIGSEILIPELQRNAGGRSTDLEDEEEKGMSLFQEIQGYQPANEQEACDKEVMLRFMEENPDCLSRENRVGHFSASIWTVNRQRTKTLMVYHNIYDSWSWIGGHADGMEDLRAVALRELQEETGISRASLVSGEIFSLETLTVDGHMKKGVYVPGHLHFNVTYLAEADEAQELTVNRDENQAVAWWTFEEALRVPRERWMAERIYGKLIDKCR